MSERIAPTFLVFLIVFKLKKASLILVSVLAPNLYSRLTELIESESEVGLGSCIVTVFATGQQTQIKVDSKR